MGAVSGGHKEVTKRLLLKGADRHLKNSEGETAIDLARSQGRQDMVRILNDQFTALEKLKICCNVKVVYKV
jgi:ankyrin repeat protein